MNTNDIRFVGVATLTQEDRDEMLINKIVWNSIGGYSSTEEAYQLFCEAKADYINNDDRGYQEAKADYEHEGF